MSDYLDSLLQKAGLENNTKDKSEPSYLDKLLVNAGIEPDPNMPKSDLGKEFSAGWANYKASMEHIPAALGSTTAAQWAAENEEKAKRYQAASKAPHEWDEVKFGDKDKGVLNYLGQLAAGSAPYVGEQLAWTVGDAITGGALTPAHAARLAEMGGQMAIRAGAKATAEEGIAKAIRGTVVGAERAYPSSTGILLKEQHDENGNYNIPAAMAMGVPYSLLNGGLGVEAAVARGGLHVPGIQNRLGRAVTTGLVTGAEEAAGEAGQATLENLAHKSVNPGYDLLGDEALKNIKESAIGGFALGKVMGTAGGAMSGYKPKSDGSDAMTQAVNSGYTATYESPEEIKARQERIAQANAPMIVTPKGDVLTNQNQVEAYQQFGNNPQILAAQIKSQQQQQQQQQSAEEQERLMSMRGVIMSKYGATPILNDSGKEIGISFNGQRYYSGPKEQERLHKAVDKIIQAEASKPELEHHVEYAYLDAYKNQNSTKPITFASLVSKVSPFITGATDLNTVLERIDNEIKIESTKKSKASQATLGFLQNFRDNLTGEQNGQQNKLPMQQQVRSDERQSSSGTGSVQSGQLQSLITGSESGGQNSQQNAASGTPSTQVVGSTTNTNASATSANQEVSTAQTEWEAMDDSGTKFESLPKPIQDAWAKAVNMGKASGEIQEELVALAKREAARDTTVDIVTQVLRKAIPESNKRRGENYNAFIEYAARTFGSTNQNEKDEKSQMNVKGNERIVAGWKREVRELLSKKGDKLRAAAEEVAKEHGVTADEILKEMGIGQTKSEEIHAETNQTALDERDMLQNEDGSSKGVGKSQQTYKEAKAKREKKQSNESNQSAVVTIDPEEYMKSQEFEQRQAEADKKSKANEEAAKQEEKERSIWDNHAKMFSLPTYDSLPVAVKADWMMSVKDGKTNLAAVNDILEKNRKALAQLEDSSNTIDGTNLITEVAEPTQRALLTDETSKLNQAQQERLEKHYGAKKDSEEFFQKLREDVIAYVTKGAAAVNGAIRDIVKQIANGVMAMAVVFNPNFASKPELINIPKYETKTVEVTAQVPTETADKMSPAAKRVWEVVWPAIKADLKAKDKLFIINDKPTAMTFVFSPDGKVLFQTKTLQSKSLGDYYKGNNDVVANRITPAGKYTLKESRGTKSSHGYDYDTVYGVSNANNDYFLTLLHSVWLHEKDAPQRAAALKDTNPANSRYSFGCINVDTQTFGKLLQKHRSQMDGATLFVVPDAQENVMDFINGKAIASTDMDREKVDPIVKKVLTSLGSTTAQINPTLYGKEERVTINNKKADKAENIASEAQNKFLDDLKYDLDLGDGVKGAEVKFIDLARHFNGIAHGFMALESIGLVAHKAIDKIIIMKNSGSSASILTVTDGKGGVQLHIGFDEASLRTETQGEMAFTTVHELGHIMDMAGFGGVYSSHPDMQFKVSNGRVTPVGSVATEIYNAVNDGKNDVIQEIFQYPLDAEYVKGMDAAEFQQEVFAQLWAMMPNKKLNALLKQAAPQTHKFMTEVFQHANTQKSVRSESEAGAQARTAVSKAAFEGSYKGSQVKGSSGLSRGSSQETVKPLFLLDTYLGKDNVYGKPEYGQELRNPVTLKNGIRLDGFTDKKQTTFSGYDKNGERISIRREYVNPEDIVSSRDSNRTAVALAGALSRVVRRNSRGATGTYDSISKQVGNIKSLSEINIARAPALLRGPLKAIWNTLFNFKETALGVMITEDLAELARKYMKSIDRYVEANHERAHLTNLHEEKLTKILAKFQELDQNTRAAVNKVIAMSTVKQQWAFDPEIEGVTYNARSDAALLFRQLPATAQEVVKAVFKQGQESLTEKKEAIYAKINEAFAEELAAAQTPEATKEIEKKKAEMTRSFQSILGIPDNSPYAPLKRFGQFVVVGKSQRYMDAEEAGNRDLMEELRSDENHYIVEFAETMGEAREIYDNLRSMDKYDGSLKEPFKKSDFKDSIFTGADLWKGFAKLKRVVAAQGTEVGANPVLKQLQGMVNELYLLSLAESSARKSELQRQNISGYNRDMMRSFFSQGMADAHYIAGLKTNDKILDAMIEMQKEAGKDSAAANPYLNEFMAREAQALETRSPSMLDMANRMTATWFLTFSPSFYLQQSTQTFMLSLPWLAGRYNYFKSQRALTAAYKEILPLVKNHNLKEHLDFSGLPKDVQEMLQVLVGRGRINIGVEAELGNVRSEAGNKAVEAFTSATDKARGIINRIEAMNRSTAAIAAYRLEMAKLQKEGKLSPEQMKVKAIDAADKVVHITHGSYDGFNTPRLFNKSPIMRSVTQFRRFQIIQLSMLGRMFHQAFKGASPTERAIGRKQLTFLLGHSFVLAGAKGMPIWGLAEIAYAVVKAVFGEKDDPEDLEAYLRKHGGLMLTKGVPAWIGVDLSDKLGMGKVTALLPYTDVDLSGKNGYEKALTGAMGPFFGGLLPKMNEAKNQVMAGDYYKGLETALPKGFSDIAKAYRFSTQGVTMKNGDVVLSPAEYSLADAAFQAVGLPTTTTTERTYRAGEVKKYEDYYRGKEADIKHQYTKAYKEGDNAAKQELRDEWNTLQSSRVKNGFKRQPISDLMKAPLDQRMREMHKHNGVEYTDSNKKFVKSLSE